jgi:hypothetical protein
MKDVLMLPPLMLASVQRTVRKGTWKFARDPVKSVRESAERDYLRQAKGREQRG